MIHRKNLDAELAAFGRRLHGAQGKQYWRSLEELSGPPEFQAFLEQEFPLPSNTFVILAIDSSMMLL